MCVASVDSTSLPNVPVTGSFVTLNRAQPHTLPQNLLASPLAAPHAATGPYTLPTNSLTDVRLVTLHVATGAHDILTSPSVSSDLQPMARFSANMCAPPDRQGDRTPTASASPTLGTEAALLAPGHNLLHVGAPVMFSIDVRPRVDAGPTEFPVNILSHDAPVTFSIVDRSSEDEGPGEFPVTILSNISANANKPVTTAAAPYPGVVATA